MDELAAAAGRTTDSLVWNKDLLYALGFYRLFARSLGIWPLTCQNFTAKILFLVAVFLQLTLNYNLIQEFAAGCVAGFNVDVIGVLVTTTVSLLKIIVIRAHREAMSSIVESAINDWWIVRDEEARKIMRRYAFLGRLVSIVQVGGGLASAMSVVLALPPTFGQQTTTNEPNAGNSTPPVPRNVLLGTECSLVDAPTYVYLGFYFFQLIQLTLLCTSSTGCDALFFGLAMHLCGQLRVLNLYISRFGHDDSSSSFAAVDDPEAKIGKDDFAAFVDRHNHLVRLVNLVEDIFHVIILGQLAASTLHISLLGIKMLYGIQDGDYGSLVYSSVAVTSLLRQIFVSSYAGDHLVTHTNAIREAAYSCCWYNFSPSLAKDVMFVIVRGNGSFRLTAGKIICMNIESFTSLLKTMFSFFSVLKLTIIE